METMQLICRLCDFKTQSRISFGMHLKRYHAISIMEHVIRFDLGGTHPLCSCGCGQEVSWHSGKQCFNDYITGHNKSGFRSKQPNFTAESVKKRNESIRRTYQERGAEIKKKISESVKKGLSISEFDFSSYRKELWQDDDFKQLQHESRLNSWKDQAGIDRREKVFTEEFGRKISIANMNRNLNYRSNAEINFFNTIKSQVDFEIITEKWIATDKRAFCFDGFIPSMNVYVEFDGKYYHGLDRSDDYTLGQIIHLANDTRKELLISSLGAELIRVMEGADASKVKTIEDLRSISYYVQRPGDPPRKRIVSDDHVLISRDTLIRMNATGNFSNSFGSERTMNEMLPALIELLRSHVDAHGWFYPTSNQSVNEVLKSISSYRFDPSSKFVSSRTTPGNEFLRARFKSYWKAGNGPVNAFKNDKILTRILKYRLGLNNSKLYTYTLNDGSSVECRETFDITLKNVRRGFVVQRNAVSWFKPTAAFEIYRRFLGNIQRPVVWDPSCGFGARMLGFAAAFSHGKYYGTEPAFHTFSDLESLREELMKSGNECEFHLQRIGSEIVKFNNDISFHLVFTSPPYFDREKYFEEPGQCWLEYPNIEMWVNRYLIPTFSTAASHLIPGGHLIINIDTVHSPLIIDVAKSVGLRYIDSLILKTGQDHYSRKKNGSNYSEGGEPILVFEKT